MIHADIWHDEKFSKLDVASRIMFIGIITIANDFGKLRGNPKYIKSQIFPYDDKIDAEKCLEEVIKTGMINSYEINGEKFLIIKNWSKFQTLTYKGKDNIPFPEQTLNKPLINPDEQYKVVQCSINQDKLNQDKSSCSPEAVELASLLKSSMLTNNPKALVKDSQVEKWSHEADLLLRVDKRLFEEAKTLLAWCQVDSFWRTNILSMGTFRKQYDKLTLHSKRKTGKEITHSGLKAWGNKMEAKLNAGS